jgi:hypothetical protein
LSAQAHELVANLQQSVQHIWEGALHKESVALEHKLDFAIVACTGVYKLADLCWQRDLPKETGQLQCGGIGPNSSHDYQSVGQANHGSTFEHMQ